MKKIARKSKTWSQNSFTIGSASVNELPFVFKTTLKEEKLFKHICYAIQNWSLTVTQNRTSELLSFVLSNSVFTCNEN